MENINWFEKAALIPSLPKVALDLIETFKEDDPDLRRLAQNIDADAVLSARILRLANSPYYATARKVKTVPEALMILGFSPVRNIALSTAVSSLGNSRKGEDMENFASLSLLSAMCCESLATEAGLEKGQAFAAGLLRPIGMLLMRAARPVEIASLDLATSVFDPRRAEEEHRMFGTDHGALSGALAIRWNLPEGISQALGDGGKPAAAAKLGQWAASRTLFGVANEDMFNGFAPAAEWAKELGLGDDFAARVFPDMEAARNRFGGLAG